MGSLTSLALACTAVGAGWFRKEDERLGPTAYLSSRRTTKTAVRPIVCLGDSITRGLVCRDWVGSLNQRLDGVPVVNAGVNFEGVEDMLKRLNEVLECHPSHVVVLAGSSEVRAEISELEGWIGDVVNGHEQTSGQEPVERFASVLEEIRDRIIAAGAQVALVSPPVLGEEAWSTENCRTALYAATVRRVAEDESGCTYLPLFERAFAKLPLKGGIPYDGSRFASWMAEVVVDEGVRREDLVELQTQRGLQATLDLVHPSEEVLETLEEMVAEFVGGRFEALDVRYEMSEGIAERRPSERPAEQRRWRQPKKAPPRKAAQPSAGEAQAQQAEAQQRLAIQGIVRTLKKLEKAGRQLVPLSDLEAEFGAQWKAPLPPQLQGEEQLAAFLAAWPRKVELVDWEGEPCVQLAGGHDRPSRLARKASKARLQ